MDLDLAISSRRAVREYAADAVGKHTLENPQRPRGFGEATTGRVV